ncbi:MAG: hypothetical protein DBX47_01875 [Clostridiales bacterium]|nr:MAG: hypothetical protein DBX47_01875 [Clostridiales bacterium]
MNDYHIQTINDLAFRKPTALKLKKRKYICPHCNKKFYEETPWLRRYSRRTMRLTKDMIIRLRKQFHILMLQNSVILQQL